MFSIQVVLTCMVVMQMFWDCWSNLFSMQFTNIALYCICCLLCVWTMWRPSASVIYTSQWLHCVNDACDAVLNLSAFSHLRLHQHWRVYCTCTAVAITHLGYNSITNQYVLALGLLSLSLWSPVFISFLTFSSLLSSLSAITTSLAISSFFTTYTETVSASK